MRPSDLSYRFKIPLAIIALILVTEIVIAVTLVSRAYRDARVDLETNARNLIAVLSRSLREPLVRDDVWQAYEVVYTPVAARTPENPLQVVIVLDASGRVFVSSDPHSVPLLTKAGSLPTSIGALAKARAPFVFQFERIDQTLEVGAAGAILSEDDDYLGTVLLRFDADRYSSRIQSTLWELVLITIPGLVILIPLGWFWGKRMAEPLTSLSRVLAQVGKKDTATIAASLPPDGKDEIGQLAQQTRYMLEGLARKEALEQEVVASERLAAVGRVSAAIAHEINNPLGGMLNAVDTLEKHGRPDSFTRKTLGLLERGLRQIKSTVGALLVEARLDAPEMAPQDWEDLKTLMQPQFAERSVTLHWSVRIADLVPLPAHQVRQLALNLLLNAAEAAPSGSEVIFRAKASASRLHIAISNTGTPIPPQLLGHLFEPFVASRVSDGRRSYGLGLWVCYQIAQQLGGLIRAKSSESRTRFFVSIPVRELNLPTEQEHDATVLG